MHFESMGKGNMPVNEALAQIMMIRSQAEVMGANDYEGSAFSQLQQRLEDGELTPEAAIAEAYSILENKQDYH